MKSKAISGNISLRHAPVRLDCTYSKCHLESGEIGLSISPQKSKNHNRWIKLSHISEFFSKLHDIYKNTDEYDQGHDISKNTDWKITYTKNMNTYGVICAYCDENTLNEKIISFNSKRNYLRPVIHLDCIPDLIRSTEMNLEDASKEISLQLLQ